MDCFKSFSEAPLHMLALAGLFSLGLASSSAFAAFKYKVPIHRLQVQAETCATPWGATLVSGQQAVGYATETVPYGSTCSEISASCDKGVLQAAGANFGACEVQGPVFDNTWNAATKGPYDKVVSPLAINTTGDGAFWSASTLYYDTGPQAHAMSTKARSSGKWFFELSSTGDGYLRGGISSAYGALLYGYLGPVVGASAAVSYAVAMDAGVIITYNVTCKVLNTKTGIPTGGSYYAAMEAGGGGWTPRFLMARILRKECLMDSKTVLEPGDVVQLSPETCRNPMFAGCLMTVTEPKAFGAQGYVQALGQDGQMGGQAYYRAHWDEMEWVGRAVWLSAAEG